MKRSLLAAVAAGALFGVGLAISGMTRPSKVLGFLDVFGTWDPSLAFVMAGAIAVHFVALRLIVRRQRPLFDTSFHLPTQKTIDARLVAGAAIFGVGWALGGFCPGPGLVSMGSGSLVALVFVVGMTAGIFLENVAAQRLVRARRVRPAT